MYMKFLCDDNLGKLARYLRMIGYDTFFQIDISDAELLAVMLKQDRIVLTRDHLLVKRIEPERCVLIESDSPEEQLKAVIRNLKLEIKISADDRISYPARFFSRCLECNEICRDVAKEDITDMIFPYIIKSQTVFRQCPACKRIYWQGSHYKDMVKRLLSVLEEI